MPLTDKGLPATQQLALHPSAEAQRHKWFARVWILALVLLVVSPGRNFGLGNTNPIERSTMLIAMLLFAWGRPIRSWALGGLGLMFTAIVTSGAVTAYPQFEWGRLAMASAALFTMLGFLVVKGRDKDVMLVLRSVAVLPLYIFALSLLLYMAFGRPLMQRDHTGAMRLGGAAIPAFLAAACYAAVVASGYLYSIKRRAVDLFFIACALVLGILSGSRMATACAGLSVVPFLFTSRKSAVFKMLLVLYASTALVCFLLTFGDQLVQRFLSGSKSGRELLWAVLEAAAERYPMFGVGFGHHNTLIPESVTVYTGTAAAHNELLRLRVELGIVGFVLFIAGWLMYWGRLATRYVTPTLTLFYLLALFVLFSTTDNTLFLSYSLLVLVSIGMGTELLNAAELSSTTPARAMNTTGAAKAAAAVAQH